MVIRTLPAGEIKRRGISAVDELIAEGPVHIVIRNQPRYVVLDEEQYADLVEGAREGMLARIRQSEADIAAGHFTRHRDVESLMAAIDAVDEDDE